MGKAVRALLMSLAMAVAAAGNPDAPRVAFTHLSLDEGLSQSSVISLLQDRQGFIWLGTWDGLNRYDGYGFTVYRHIAGVPGSLASSQILSLGEDGTGRLWVGTSKGLHRFEPESGTFARYPLDEADRGREGPGADPGDPAGPAGLPVGCQRQLPAPDRSGHRRDPPHP